MQALRNHHRFKDDLKSYIFGLVPFQTSTLLTLSSRLKVHRHSPSATKVVDDLGEEQRKIHSCHSMEIAIRRSILFP